MRGWCDRTGWYIGRSAFHEICRRFCFLNKKNPTPEKTLSQYKHRTNTVALLYVIHTVYFLTINISANTYIYIYIHIYIYTLCGAIFMTSINCYIFRNSQDANIVFVPPYRTMNTLHTHTHTHTHTHAHAYIYKYIYVYNSELSTVAVCCIF